MKKIDTLCENIRHAPAIEYSVADLARQFGLTPDHFILVFKKETGYSPYAFILHARIELAQSCLQSASMSIAQIATNCGFTDIYSFSKFFKADTGMSPRAFRNRIKKFFH